MTKPELPVAIDAAAAAPRKQASNYPAPFAARVSAREKRPLGDLFGVTNFGVNHTRLAPGGHSALQHRHSKQDEFIYVLEGEPTLVTDTAEMKLRPGMCAGFAAGGAAHHIENRTGRDVVILEVGDRSQGDEVFYPDDDVQAVLGDDGQWLFTRKNGTPY